MSRMRGLVLLDRNNWAAKILSRHALAPSGLMKRGWGPGFLWLLPTYLIVIITDGCPWNEHVDELRNAILDYGRRLKAVELEAVVGMLGNLS